jgi:Bacterial SH3 domain
VNLCWPSLKALCFALQEQRQWWVRVCYHFRVEIIFAIARELEGSMGQLMLSPSANVLSIGAARNKKTAAKNTSDNLPVSLQAPLTLTPQRLELIKALAKEMSRSPAERIRQPPPRQLTVARIDQQQPSQVLLVLPRKFWALLSALILVALLPNLTLAPIFWLRFFDKPTSTPLPVTEKESATANQSIPATPTTLSANSSSIDNPSTVATPVLSAPSIVEAIIGQDMRFPIAIDGTDGIPAASMIVVKGLPPGSKLSNGRPVGDTEWSLRPDEIGDLHLMLHDNVVDESTLTIQLVTHEGHVLADTATIIKRAIEPEASAVLTRTGAQPMDIQASSEEARQLEVVGASMADAAPLSARNTKAENDDVAAKWIKPSASVNLRKGPSSSASIISVVERGTKLRAIARKKGWVQVSNPATSEKGWIYAGNVDGVR